MKMFAYKLKNSEITAKMPYGNVTIRDPRDAAAFLVTKCKFCPYSNEMNSCSGEQVTKCNNIVDIVCKTFGIGTNDG